MTASNGLPSAVSDARANAPELVVHVADSIGRSIQRRRVFEAVYYHKKRVKTVSEIEQRTGLPRIRVLQRGRELVQRGVVGQTKKDGEVAYEQDPFIQAHKAKILRLVDNPEQKKKVATKRNPNLGADRAGSSAVPVGGVADAATQSTLAGPVVYVAPGHQRGHAWLRLHRRA